MVVLEFIDEEYYELDGERYEIKDNKINCSNSHITKVIGLIPNNLKELVLSGNQITEFTQDLNQLKVLILSGNQITEFNQNLNQLKTLSLSFNQLTKFTQDLNQLENLYLSVNLITKFIQELNQLKELFLWGNPIKDLNNKFYVIANVKHCREYQKIVKNQLKINSRRIKSARN